jgi:hypothetical protein
MQAEAQLVTELNDRPIADAGITYGPSESPFFHAA